MSSWENVLNNFPPEHRLELTEEEQAYIPVYATDAFAADYKETRCLFARFLTPGIWCEGVETPWKFTTNNEALVIHKFRFLILHLDEVNNFDFIQRTATFHGKQIKWDTLYSEWKYLNNRKVHFQSPSTSEAEETQPQIPEEIKKANSFITAGSAHDSDSDKESTHSKSSTDEDTLNVSNLLQEAETRIVATIQKLTSRPSTPSPQGTPSRPTSALPGSSKLSIPEESSLPTSPVSKGKAKEEPLLQTLAGLFEILASHSSTRRNPVNDTTSTERKPQGNTTANPSSLASFRKNRPTTETT